MIEAVEIATHNGLILRGEVAMRASDWIVLVHAPTEDIDAWQPLSTALEDYSLTVLAVDLRGHGGSDGDPNPDSIAADIDAMVDYATDHGALRMFLAAAGASTHSAQLAADRHPFEALILVAPVGLQASVERAIPRLLVYDPDQPEQEAAVTEAHGAPGLPVAISLAGTGSGLDVLQSEWRDNVVGYVAAFLRDVRLRQPFPQAGASDS